MAKTAGMTFDASGERIISKSEERRVIVASSVGTVFEWYDFYLYAILAPFFAGLFFPPGNQTAALLGAFGAYAAGFLIRPFGALIFGRVGDLVGRKYTFLVTIVVMRRLLRDIADGRMLGDTTTLADPAVVAKLKEQYEE